MDAIKNCRMLPVNLSDIGALEERDPNIWQFLRWTIFVQVNYIQETEKSVDHAGEQENKKLKVQGGSAGITRQRNSRNKFLVILYVVSRIEKELREISR